MTHGGRKGSAAFYLRPGDLLTLAEERGTTGTIRRIWITLSDLRPSALRALRLRLYWDGAGDPAVDAPVGDFFGAALGRIVPFSSALFASPEGRSFACFAPMPFRTGMRVTVANEGPDTLYQLYYEVDYTVGDPHGDGLLYFHAHYRCENPTVARRDYRVLPEVRGRGRFLGAFLGVAADTASYGTAWWGEGECRIWIDGDGDHPTLCGTGTEDWIGTAWELGGAHGGPSQGCHLADHQRRRYGLYRFHLDDPVCFARRIVVAFQQIGSWKPDSLPVMRLSGKEILHAGPGSGAGEPGGPRRVDPDVVARSQPYGLFEREDLWSSCAFFCLDRPEGALPPIDPVDKRLADIPDREEFDMKEQRMVPREVRSLQRWIPAFEQMRLEDFEEVRDAAAAVAAAMRDQERILREAGEGAS
jgi:hypothetical protein